MRTKINIIVRPVIYGVPEIKIQVYKIAKIVQDRSLNEMSFYFKNKLVDFII